jgi:hypothetical protein
VAALATLEVALVPGVLARRRERRAESDGWRAAVLLALAAVPAVMAWATRPDVHPAINRDSGGATGGSLLGSTLGLALIVALLPILAGRPARRPGVATSTFVLLGLHFAAFLLLDHGDHSHHEPLQVVALGSPRRPLLAVTTLFVALGVALGLIALWPGHLMLLSAFFASIPFVLGIDFALHLLGHVEELAARGLPEREAIPEAVRDLGGALATAALTTSPVFWSMACSGFHGFAERGIVAGTGLLACLVAMLALLPALLVVVAPRPRRARSPSERRLGRPFPAPQHPALAAAVGLAAPAGLACRLRSSTPTTSPSSPEARSACGSSAPWPPTGTSRRAAPHSPRTRGTRRSPCRSGSSRRTPSPRSPRSRTWTCSRAPTAATEAALDPRRHRASVSAPPRSARPP